jgi:ADP-heptose:LPS heptosyltransferase
MPEPNHLRAIRFNVLMFTTFYSSMMAHLLRLSWELKVVGDVPSDQRRFLQHEVYKPRWIFKFIKRWALFSFLGQRRYLVETVPPSVKRILWINLTAPSLGDSLMDLSARRLLAGREVHLLTSGKNAGLYVDDPYVSKVMTEVEETRSEHARCFYDLIIVDSFSPRSLFPKVKIAPDCPLAGVYGFLNGFEVHRTLYAYARVGYLLRLSHEALYPRVTELTLGQDLQGETTLSALKKRGRVTVAIGIGGEWAFRTYRGWLEVITILLNETPDLSILLLGSTNGLEDAARIECELSSTQVLNLVGKTSLAESCSVLRVCDVYLGADGGLWHMASACGIPTVAIFADCQLFNEEGEMVSRASPDQMCMSLITRHDVNDISPATVSEAALHFVRSNRKT